MISLRIRLWIGFGGLLLVLLIASTLSVGVFTSYSRTLESIFRENYDSAVYCNRMIEALDDMNARALRLSWAAENASTKPAASNDAAVFERNLQQELSNSMLPGEKEKSESIAAIWSAFKADYQTLESSASDHPLLYRQGVLPKFESMKADIRQIEEMNLVHMTSVDVQVRDTLAWARNTLMALVAGGTLLAAFVVWIVGASVLVPLRGMTRSAQQIEAGDLEQTLPVRTRDEIGKLAAAFNSMAAKLREFRRLDQHRLVRTEQTTQLAIDSLTDPVFVIGTDETIEISNRAARTHFGIEPGSPLANLGLTWLTPLYAMVKAQGVSVDAPGYKGTIQLFDDGEERFLLPRVLPMLGKERELIGVAVILVDITRLRRVDEAKSSVISTVSHELRTPLTGIRMSLSLLASDSFGPTTPEQRQLIAASREETDRLHRIIENLLNISRIESGRSQFHFRLIAVDELIAHAIDPLRGAFAERQLALSVTVQPGMPPITADLPSIGSALINLLTNALKFTPPGGKVAVRCEAQADTATFEVSDNGPGIPAEFRGRIFEKFFRIPTASGPTGAGLGLSIAKEIVQAHGGEIGFHCPADGGTTFRLRIPLNVNAGGVP